MVTRQDSTNPLRAQLEMDNLAPASRWSFNCGWVLFFGLFCLLAGMSVLRYLSLHSTYADLGIYLNHFNKPLGDWWRLFIGHTQLLMPIWSFICGLLPKSAIPITVLSAQAAVLAWPVALLYRHFGLIPAVAFILYFPLWYNALFDFHTDHLAVALLFGFFFLVKKDRIGWAMSLALVLALVKEIYALQTIACGLYLLLTRKHREAGLSLMVAGGFWFFIAINYLLPYFSMGMRGGMDSPAYSWLGNSMGEIIWTITTKPHLILNEILSNHEKVKYLLAAFGALMFIPLLRPEILLVALPILAISLLSRSESYAGFQFHYTAGLIAPFVMAFAGGLPTAQRFWEQTPLPKNWFAPLLLTGILVGHIIISPSPIGRYFWRPGNYHASAYLPTNRDTMIKEALRRYIPSDTNVTVSTQNTLNWGHLIQRKYYLPFPIGVFQPFQPPNGANRTFAGLWNFIRTGNMAPAERENIFVDYVTLDLKRAWSVSDKSCYWHHGKCHNNEDVASEFLELVRQTKDQFETVFEKDEFLILKRRNFLP